MENKKCYSCINYKEVWVDGVAMPFCKLIKNVDIAKVIFFSSNKAKNCKNYHRKD